MKVTFCIGYENKTAPNGIFIEPGSCVMTKDKIPVTLLSNLLGIVGFAENFRVEDGKMLVDAEIKDGVLDEADKANQKVSFSATPITLEGRVLKYGDIREVVLSPR